MGLHEALHDGQPQAASLLKGELLALLDPVELVEDQLLVLGGDADTGVPNLQEEIAVLLAQHHLHRS